MEEKVRNLCWKEEAARPGIAKPKRDGLGPEKKKEKKKKSQSQSWL
jgi:hypothetical protein